MICGWERAQASDTAAAVIPVVVEVEEPPAPESEAVLGGLTDAEVIAAAEGLLVDGTHGLWELACHRRSLPATHTDNNAAADQPPALFSKEVVARLLTLTLILTLTLTLTLTLALTLTLTLTLTQVVAAVLTALASPHTDAVEFALAALWALMPFAGTCVCVCMLGRLSRPPLSHDLRWCTACGST